MGVDETLLHEVIRGVLTVASPDRIMLFGSAATGRMTGDSDLDLLVVEPDPANTRDRSVAIRRAPGDVRRPAGPDRRDRIPGQQIRTRAL